MSALPVFLYTDFGSGDIYVGQVKAMLHATSAASAVVDLMNDLPSFNIVGAAHLLAALAPELPRDSVIMAVVDPGVGGERDAIALQADSRWYVGPDNGVMSVVAARAAHTRCYTLNSLPAPKSRTFHGRDLFAPVAGSIACGTLDRSRLAIKCALDVDLGPGDLMQLIYIDHYGNAMTGVRFDKASPEYLQHGTQKLPICSTFSDVPAGEVFCYRNSIGLVEIAANQASAASLLNLHVGDPVAIGSASA